MATSNAFFRGFLNPQPTIIPPSAGDLEEARIRRALDLAKLKQLQDSSSFQERDQLLQQRAQDVTQRGQDIESENNRQRIAVEQAGLSLTQRAQDVTQRGQDIEARGQDVSANAAKDREHMGLLTDLLRNHVDHGGDLATAARAARAAGVPELANQLDKEQETALQKKVAAHLVTVAALQHTGGNVALHLKDLEDNQPEVYAALKPHLSNLKVKPTDTNAESAGTRLGNYAGTVTDASVGGPFSSLLTPAVAGYKAGKGYYDKNKTQVEDFFNALLGRRSKRP